MNTIARICVGLMLLVVVADAAGQGTGTSERAVMKQVLMTTIKQLKSKVTGDQEASTALEKLGNAGDPELDRMMGDIKASFNMDRLDPAAVTKIDASLKETIDGAAPSELRNIVKNRGRGSEAIPPGQKRPIRATLCWLWGCK